MSIQSPIKKGKLYVAIVLGWLVYLSISAVAQRQRQLRGTRGTYCDGQVIREKSANSALQCAGACSNDAKCVAYCQRNSKCLLHADSAAHQTYCQKQDLSMLVSICFSCSRPIMSSTTVKFFMVLTLTGYVSLLAAYTTLVIVVSAWVYVDV